MGCAVIDLHFCHPSTAPTGVPRLHIQAYPPPFMVALTGGRHVPELQPTGEERELMLRLVQARKAGHPAEPLHLAAYELSYKARMFHLLDRVNFCPESLQDDLQSPITGPVALLCTCSVAEAAAGRCHRAWAAQVLSGAADFAVWLDGRRLEEAA